MDEKLLKEAVEFYRKWNEETDGVRETEVVKKHQSILLDLAEQYLKIEGFPEKKPCGKSYNKEDCKRCHYFYDCETVVFNEALQQCKLAVMKEYVGKKGKD